MLLFIIFSNIYVKSRDLEERQRGRRRERHKVREKPKGPLRIAGGKRVDALRSVQSRSQSFVPLDQLSEKESSGSIHFRIAMENQ